MLPSTLDMVPSPSTLDKKIDSFQIVRVREITCPITPWIVLHSVLLPLLMNNDSFLFWRKLTDKYDQMCFTRRRSEVQKNEKNEEMLTFKRDSSSGLPSLEVEDAADPVSSPRSLSFLHMSPGSVYLVTCSKRIQNHSSEISKVCIRCHVRDSRKKTTITFFVFCFSSLSIPGWSHLQTLMESRVTNKCIK